MKFLRAAIPEVLLIESEVFRDERGFFMETWERMKFAEAGVDFDFVQDNHCWSVKNTLRGLHYQVGRPQGKLVRVTHGAIFDVAVDLRKNSSTFGDWVGAYLTADNKRMFWIPPCFAHGLYVVSEAADVIYKCTDYYAPSQERAILWDDPDLAVAWPIPKEHVPIVSVKDRNASSFREAEVTNDGASRLRWS
jgi:dTDP-4-dehydrorhamnose 3,5-epimerase